MFNVDSVLFHFLTYEIYNHEKQVVELVQNGVEWRKMLKRDLINLCRVYKKCEGVHIDA